MSKKTLQAFSFRPPPNKNLVFNPFGQARDQTCSGRRGGC
jgi:hypothetical protein